MGQQMGLAVFRGKRQGHIQAPKGIQRGRAGSQAAKGKAASSRGRQEKEKEEKTRERGAYGPLVEILRQV